MLSGPGDSGPSQASVHAVRSWRAGLPVSARDRTVSRAVAASSFCCRTAGNSCSTVVSQIDPVHAPWAPSASAAASCEHIAIPRRLAGAMSTTWYDLTTTLGFLAGVTERVRLLSHIAVLPLHHPLSAAKAFATLDVLSRGRAVIGVAAGHVPEEFGTLGVDFATRGARLDEAMQVLDLALREEFVEWDWPLFPVHDMGIRPRPVQQPQPPIWVGGSSPRAIRRAAQLGEGWLPQGNPRSEMPALIEQLLSRRAEVRDDPITVNTITEPLNVGSPRGTSAAGRSAAHRRSWPSRCRSTP